MAYCNKCGAYIPDDETKCYACGYDEAEAKAAESAAAAASAVQEEPVNNGEYHYSNRVNSEQLRQQLENQRKKQQEYSRRWAENESARRENERQERERARQWAEEQRRSTTGRPVSRSAPEETVRSFGTFSTKNKLLAITSYLGILCVLPFFCCKDDDFAMFHARQGLTLLLCFWILRVALSLLRIGWIASVARLVLAVIGMLNARDGKKQPLPYIGTLMFKD